jgi:hypothetical protein
MPRFEIADRTGTDTVRVGVRAEILDDERPALLRLRNSRVFVHRREDCPASRGKR